MRNQTIFMIIGVFLLLTVGSPVAGADDKPIIRALVVGINEYAIKPLPFAKIDALDFEKLLRSLGVTEITTLYDSQALKDNVINKMKEVASKCDANDIFIFFYSGHGSFVKDKDGDEKDGYDEGIVALMTHGSGILVKDDEIDNILSQCKASVVWSIFDSCHSGGTTKAFYEDGIDRYYPMEEDEEKSKDMTTQDKPLMITREQTAGQDEYGFLSDKPSNPHQVVFTGTRADELGWEYSSLKHGAFSYFFLESLTTGAPKVDKNCDSLVSFSEIYQYCYDKVSQYRVNKQHPTSFVGPAAKDINLFKLTPDGKLTFNVSSAKPPEKPSLDVDIKSIADSIEKIGNDLSPKYTLKADCDKTIYHPGDVFNLSVSVDEACYLYLVNVFYGGEVDILFPNFNIKENLVKAGTLNMDNLIGAENQIQVMPESKGGTEYVLVVASPIKLNLESLVKQPLSRSYVFGEIDHNYGSRGGLGEVLDTTEENCRRLWITPKVNAPDKKPEKSPEKVADKSVTVSVVKYQVE